MGKKAKVRSGLGNIGRIGGRGVKDAVFLYGARKISPDFAGKYQGGVDKLLAGGLERVAGRFKSGGASLFEVGIAEIGANLIEDFIEPLIAVNLTPRAQRAAESVGAAGVNLRALIQR